MRDSAHAQPRLFLRVFGMTVGYWCQPDGWQIEDRRLGATKERCTTFTRTGNEGVDVHQFSNPWGDVVERARDDSTAVGEADEDDVAKILVEHSVHNILHVSRQADLRVHEMRSFTDAGQAGREHLMPVQAQRAAKVTELVRATPPSMHQHEDRRTLGQHARILPDIERA